MRKVLNGIAFGDPTRKVWLFDTAGRWDEGTYTDMESVGTGVKLTESPADTFTASGTWESPVFDSGVALLDWGFMDCWVTGTSGGTVEFTSRAGSTLDLSAVSYSNPVVNRTKLGVIGRYFQFKLALEDDTTESPSVDTIRCYYDSTLVPTV